MANMHHLASIEEFRPRSHSALFISVLYPRSVCLRAHRHSHSRWHLWSGHWWHCAVHNRAIDCGGRVCPAATSADDNFIAHCGHQHNANMPPCAPTALSASRNHVYPSLVTKLTFLVVTLHNCLSVIWPACWIRICQVDNRLML